MTREKEIADAIKRKLTHGARTITIGREMAREIIKCLEGKGCRSEEKRETG